MYKLIPFSDDLDLSEFYQTAKERGFENNADRHMLVETIAKEDEWQVWMLLYNDKIVGSTAAHSFPEMGPDSYRIAVRTCAFTDMMPIHRVRTVTGIIEHQHVSPQFFMTAGMDYFGHDKNYFITSNGNAAGTQRRVHRTWAPVLAKEGTLSKECDMHYRGTDQTIWRVNVDKFYADLEKYGRWPIDRVLSNQS
jgi:hypothetical protein